MTQNVKYVAELSSVKEVSLLGTANLSYWQAYLEPLGLEPTKAEGKAQILIIAASSRFRGFPFQEVSFSVLVNPKSAQSEFGNGSYLLHAFNSVRFFAFTERFFFSTPYTYGQCEIVTKDLLKIEVLFSEKRIFLAQMVSSVSERVIIESGKGGWDGPVFLPAKGSKKYFMAKISGQTTTFAFEPERDKIAFPSPSASPCVLNTLLDSEFEGKFWYLRQNAYHAKSKTRYID